jgi:hypothetical protein
MNEQGRRNDAEPILSAVVCANGELDRCLRDRVTMNQDMVNSLRSYPMAGRVLLGLAAEEFLL